jgi:hypothetical protein
MKLSEQVFFPWVEAESLQFIRLLWDALSVTTVIWFEASVFSGLLIWYFVMQK